MSAGDQTAPGTGPEEPKLGARHTLIGAAVLSAVGVGVAGTVDRTVGGVIVVAGWLALVYALHAFGRSRED